MAKRKEGWQRGEDPSSSSKDLKINKFPMRPDDNRDKDISRQVEEESNSNGNMRFRK